MRIVADTNVLVSGLFWHGAPHRLLEHARNGTVMLFSSAILLAELDNVLRREKFAAVLARSSTTRQDALAQLGRLVDLIEPEPLPRRISRDPDDDHVVACALAARAEASVSGDHDLLDLGEYQGIPILSATRALARIA